MSRHVEELNSNTKIIHGKDVALGYFVDVEDARYQNDEGLPLVEWSQKYGFSTNQIGVLLEDLSRKDALIAKVDKFIEQNTNG